MKKQAFGIDLGTTFSSIAVYSKTNEVDIISDSKFQTLIPSIVSFNENENNIITSVGNFAKQKQILNPKSTIFDTKRMLAQKINDSNIQNMIKKWPFDIEEDENGEILVCLDKINKKYKPYEISGEILKSLVEMANLRFPQNERTNDVVITIPANFKDKQRLETLEAAKYAGLNVLTIINEPTAAGIAYGMHNCIKDPCKVVVFDFGGGTLDISLLNVDQNSIKVEATEGDMFLGGRDFDENVVDFFIKKFNLDQSFVNNPKKMSKLRNSVVDLKIELSYSDNSVFLFENNDKDFEYDMTLEEFETINKDLIDRILIPVERLLKSSKVDKKSIKHVILIGGSSNMKFVKKKLTEYFGIEPFNGFDPAQAVVSGAAIVANSYINNDQQLMKKN